MGSINKFERFVKMGADGSPPEGLGAFDTALAFTMSHEGGHLTAEEARAQGDRGGETMYGFSTRANPDIDFATFTPTKARELAKVRYWDKIRGDDLPPVVSFVAFDYAFNSGVPWATREIRRAAGLPEKGEIDEPTLRALRKDPNGVARNLIRQRSAFLALQSVKQPQFARGWHRRLAENAWAAGKLAQRHAPKTEVADVTLPVRGS